MAFKNGNVLARLGSIPLLNSAYQLAGVTYTDIKGANPLVGFLCGAVERSASAVVGVAGMAATPVLKRAEVPLAALNSFTLRGVDKLEARFPILDQPVDEVLGNLQDSLATSMEQLRASTTERVGRLAERVRGLVEDVTGTAGLGVSIFLNSGIIGQVLEPGAEAALSLMEPLVNRYLPATEEETRRLASSPRGREPILENERTHAGRLQRLISTSARRAYWSVWSYAEGLWKLMRRLLNQLLESAVALRRRLHRALVALTETDDSDPGPRSGFPQDPIPVRRAHGRRSSWGSISSKASSDGWAVKNSVQDGSDDRFTSSPAWRRLPATLNLDSPGKKSLSPPPLAGQLREGSDRSRLGRSMDPGHHPFSATVE